jgi:hypothetical protein
VPTLRKLARDNHRIATTGSAANDFSESWGIRGIPAVFLIDAEGKLATTEARGRLDELIPRLLARGQRPAPEVPVHSGPPP